MYFSILLLLAYSALIFKVDFYAGIIELALAFLSNSTISIFKTEAISPCIFNVIIDMAMLISKGHNSNLCI